MSGRPQRTQQMFVSLKAMFPHIDLSIVNQQLSFSENLQNIVMQLGIPKQAQTHSQINNMKEAVDQQQLKIQKSLVNEQDILGNITNRSARRQRNQKQKQSQSKYLINAIQQQQSSSQSQFWHNEQNAYNQPKQNQYLGKTGQSIHDIIEEIWELGSENARDWFHH